MGVSIHYWAVPPASALYERLLTEQDFVTLMSTVEKYVGGAFYFFDDLELEPQEREDILDHIISRGRLGDEQQARHSINEFRREVERTRRAYPGIERRQTSLEKISLVVEQSVKEALRQLRGDADRFVSRIMYGSPGLGIQDWVGLVPADLVREGARTLATLNAEALFADDTRGPTWHAYLLESFKHWQGLYRDAAAHGDAILVGVD